MKYFIAGYYNSTQMSQNQWANTELQDALLSGNVSLFPGWPGQACDITQDCAIPEPIETLFSLPCTIIFSATEKSGQMELKELVRECGELEAGEILALLGKAKEIDGEGGIGPTDGDDGINPIGILSIPNWLAWLAAIGAFLYFNENK